MRPSYSGPPTGRDGIRSVDTTRGSHPLATVRAVMVWHLWARLAGGTQRLRRLLSDVGATAVLVALAGVLALGALTDPDLMRPGTVLAIPVLLGGLGLPLREFRLLVIGCVLLGGLVVAARGLWVLSIGTVLVFVVVVAVSYEQTRRRERVGVRRARPDQILLDLRERLRVQGEVPPLPAGWGMEVELRPADDSGLAGDFVVSRVHAVEAADGRHDLLDLALVDVSGKGVDAGTRALLLSGALGGLLGAVPPEDFLAEANRYLLQQRWARVSRPRSTCGWTSTTGDVPGGERRAPAGRPPRRGQRHLAAAAAARAAARRAAAGRPAAGHRRAAPRRRGAALLRRRRRGPAPRPRGRRRPAARRGGAAGAAGGLPRRGGAARPRGAHRPRRRPRRRHALAGVLEPLQRQRGDAGGRVHVVPVGVGGGAEHGARRQSDAADPVHLGAGRAAADPHRGRDAARHVQRELGGPAGHRDRNRAVRDRQHQLDPGRTGGEVDPRQPGAAQVEQLAGGAAGHPHLPAHPPVQQHRHLGRSRLPGPHEVHADGVAVGLQHRRHARAVRGQRPQPVRAAEVRRPHGHRRRPADQVDGCRVSAHPGRHLMRMDLTQTPRPPRRQRTPGPSTGPLPSQAVAASTSASTTHHRTHQTYPIPRAPRLAPCRRPGVSLGADDARAQGGDRVSSGIGW